MKNSYECKKIISGLAYFDITQNIMIAVFGLRRQDLFFVGDRFSVMTPDSQMARIIYEKLYPYCSIHAGAHYIEISFNPDILWR